MSDVETIKARILFLGLVYFRSCGGYNRDEILNKFNREVKKIEIEPFDEKITGYPEIDEPVIQLFAQGGHKLNLSEFNSNIKEYRGAALHALITRFMIKRDENGRVLGTGLFQRLDRNPKLNEYLRTSKVNRVMKQIGVMTTRLFCTDTYGNEFGRGANEGYTEWFRKNILKNNENISYERITQVFDDIQTKLANRGGNAIEQMKKFKDGDYDYIFNTLNMSKEVGILFIRTLDYMYVREYEQETIKKYLEAKKMQKELRGEKKDEELLARVDKFCTTFEGKIRQSKRFKKCESQQDFLYELNRYFKDSDDRESEKFETVKTILERADRQQGRKLEISDIKDVQKDISFKDSGNAMIARAKTFIDFFKGKVKDVFQAKTDKNMKTLDSKEGVALGEKTKRKIRKPSLTNFRANRFKTKKSERGLTNLINKKIKNIAYNMGISVQDTVNNIKLTMDDISSEVGSTVDNIKADLQEHERELKSMAILAMLAALGISAGFFVKHCIDGNINEASAIEKVMREGTKENEQIEIGEDTGSEELQEPQKIGEDGEQQKDNSIEEYLKNGINLRKGDRIYTSYQTGNDTAKIAYDYEKLRCDLVRVVRDNEILRDGTLENIDELYKIGKENDAKVMLRTGILNEDGSMTYIAWCNLDEVIESSEKTTEERSNSDVQDEYER